MKAIRFALIKIIPLIFSYLFVGIASGVLLHEAGYSVFWAFLSGLIIYAGSMQIVMVSLMTSGTPLLLIALMTFFINARHIFYGIGFIEEFRRIGKQKHSLWKYPYMALTMTDETYSVLCSIECPKDTDKQKVEFYILFFCHILWVASCTAGALIGSLIPFDLAGIDFSATAFFTVVTVNQWRQFSSHLPAVAGFVSAVLFYLILGADHFILPALAVSMIVLMLLKDRITLNIGGSIHE